MGEGPGGLQGDGVCVKSCGVLPTKADQGGFRAKWDPRIHEGLDGECVSVLSPES